MKKYKKNINLTRSYLQNAAYRYLERYATTEANLVFILERKVARIIKDQSEQDSLREQASIWIREIVMFCVKNNLINDLVYAKSKLTTFLNAGNSLAMAKNKLRMKGVPADIISEVVNEAKSENPLLNYQSCIKYARKRRFGPFRMKEKTENTEKKEQAAMARAGFSYDETMKILRSNREELEEILYNE